MSLDFIIYIYIYIYNRFCFKILLFLIFKPQSIERVETCRPKIAFYVTKLLCFWLIRCTLHVQISTSGWLTLKINQEKGFNVHRNLHEDRATCTYFLSRKMTIRRNNDEVAYSAKYHGMHMHAVTKPAIKSLKQRYVTQFLRCYQGDGNEIPLSGPSFIFFLASASSRYKLQWTKRDNPTRFIILRKTD